MKPLFMLSLLLFLFMKSFSCSCIPMTIAEEVRNSDLIIRGTVISIDTVFIIDTHILKKYRSSKKRFNSSFRNYLVKIKTTKEYKGKLTSDTVSILTGHGGGDCGFFFYNNMEYIIYANQTKHTQVKKTTTTKNRSKYIISDLSYYQTNVCRRTTGLISKEEILLKKELAGNNIN